MKDGINISEFLVGTPYKQKINFKIFKKYDTFENNAFLTCVSKGLISEDELNEVLKLIKPEQKLIVSLQRDQKITNDRVICLYEHPKDFHALFNTYVYYHTGYFDPHPRLFHECYFYNKEIIYINKNNIKDGGYFRYKEIQKLKELNEKIDSEC